MILGLDVSYYQDVNATPQKIDFVKMKAAGVRFVYIRVAFGTTMDEDFPDNWKAAKAAGLLRGGYCFWNYWEGAPKTSKQVAFWKSLLEADPGEMPPALDMEQANANFPELPASSVCVDAVWQFSEMCREMIRAAMLYTNLAALFARLKNAPAWMVNQVLLWLAHWYIDPANLKPSPWKRATIWQQGLGKGRGIDFGVESLDVDVDYFMGTEAELYQLAGVTTPAPEPTEEYPMAFETNAVGIQLGDANTAAVVPPGVVNFVVVDLGKGRARSLRATQHMETVKTAGAACVGLFEIDPEECRTYDFDDEAKWPTAADDPQMQALTRQLMSGTAKRRVHAIILSLRKFLQSDNTTVTAGWQKRIADHYMRLIYKTYALPVYLMIDKSLVAQYPGTNELTNYLAHMPRVSTYQSAYLDDVADVTVSDWSKFPRPDALDKPGQPYAAGWEFWKYSNTKFDFTGIIGDVPLWMFYRDAPGMYAEIGYTEDVPLPEIPDPVIPDPTDPETPTSIDLTAVHQKLDAIGADLRIVRKFIEDMRGL